MYYRVVILTRSFDDYGFSYKSSKFLELGSIVWVPFGEAEEVGILMSVSTELPEGIEPESVKEIISVLESGLILEYQRELIDHLSQKYITLIHHCANLFLPKNTIEKLSKDTFAKVKIHDFDYTKPTFTLSTRQQGVFDEILSGIDNEKYSEHLIYGVTGSGKTAIYIKLISHMLEQGKQSLLLIPEIILSSQLATTLTQHFGNDVIMIHSGVSAAKKTQHFAAIRSSKAKIIVGTRSALFYPYSNLGCIIIDEEHDKSYISEISPCYHADDIANQVATKLAIPLIYGSGTPRATTMYRALQGEMYLYQMLEVYK